MEPAPPRMQQDHNFLDLVTPSFFFMEVQWAGGGGEVVVVVNHCRAVFLAEMPFAHDIEFPSCSVACGLESWAGAVHGFAITKCHGGKLGSLTKRDDYLRNSTHSIIGMFLRLRPLDKQCFTLFVVFSASCVIEG